MVASVLGASDAEFLEKMGKGEAFEPDPVVEDTTKTTTEEGKTPGEGEETIVEKTAEEIQAEADEAARVAAEEAKAKEIKEIPAKVEPDKDAPKDETKTTSTEKQPGTAAKGEGVVEQTKTEDKTKVPPAKSDAAATTTAAAIDHKAVYETLMAPLKANGTTLDIKSPEEARQLMAMGANYTEKMVAMAPHRKVLSMLESNGLLDENQISYAIDLMRKDPAAIHKLIKESGINPIDIDLEQSPRYVEGGHKVSDAVADFQATCAEIKALPGGMDTLKDIQATWDDTSKDFLLNRPAALATIHEQRANGTYATIAAEVDRQKTVGKIDMKMPFIEAYQKVGDELVAAYKAKTPAAPTVPVPIATKVATPKGNVKDNERAAAAASSRSTPAAAKPNFNPLAMSDKEFMALPQLTGR